ncbi:MAG TPA: glycosyl hydrolase family 28 protein [Candidatus Sulfotelmatobacter sp.]|jgi:polygalacturonase|nr:glycosyl hydrolase family 28 protein [Candidatus Sulfotelmatobacter sp.]
MIFARLASLVSFAAIILAGCVSASAQIYAYDDAGNGIIWTNNPLGVASQTWTNGMNTGYGWLSPWVLLQTVRNNAQGNYAGFYDHNGSTIATTNNSSWGMFANGNGVGGTNKAFAARQFPSLTTGQTFKIQWQCKGVASGGTSANRGGFALRNGMTTNSYLDYDTGSRFDFCYEAGGSSFLILDGGGTLATGIPFTTNGFNCEFTLEPGNTYHFVVHSALDNSVLYITDGRSLTGSGTIDSVAGYDIQCQDGDQNFNRLQIVSTALVPPVIFNITPTNSAYFVNPTNKMSFEVDSLASTVTGANVSLLLNGVPQTLVFNTAGATQKLLATNTTPMATNMTYVATIIATDANGNSTTNFSGFNTVQTNSLWVDAKNYGATGNGTTKDTAAIQLAISHCPSGGYVWLHNGTFLSGTIILTNNMTLYIDPTATLLGSGSSSDYPVLNPPANNSQQGNCDLALVYAQGSTNVTIDGGGTVNGNGRNNFQSGVESTRPLAIWTALCNTVKIQNINIVDAGCWTLVNMNSDFLTISNVNVNDDGLNGNRDGTDVVDCWHVVIANCTIDSGDDSICLKSGNTRGCNDVLVKNCTITRSQSNGLKFGTASTGTFTNITFQDCTVMNTVHSAMAVESVDGGKITDVTYQRINFSGCQNAIFVVLGSRSGATVGSINGITFSNIYGANMTDTRGCPITGCFTNGVDYKIQNITFNDVNIAYEGALNFIPTNPPVEYSGQYPENTIWTNLPAYGYYVRHATNVVFTNCYSAVTPADARPWLATNDVSKFTVYGPVLNPPSAGNNLVLQWNKNFVLQSSTNLTGSFQDVPGAPDPYTNPPSVGPQCFFRLRQ